MAHSHSRTAVEVVLVRPPLYLTVPEYDALCALAVTAGLAPPLGALDRTRRAKVLKCVVAELCRRTILRVHCGVARFPEIPFTGRTLNYPLRAYQRQKTFGGRFHCLACEHRHGHKRRVGQVSMRRARARDAAIEKLAIERAKNTALRAELAAVRAELVIARAPAVRAQRLENLKKGRRAA